jgi:3-phenylpropionate/cinnamic acid dioxygenase small subunit
MARTRVVIMQAELQDLLDKQAISDLIHAYAEGIDRRDHALLARLFSADARLHYGAYDQPASALVQNWRVDIPSPFIMTHHLVGNIRIRLQPGQAEGRRARSITYLYAVHRARRDGALVDEMVRARYLDRLLKQDGSWRFVERTLVFDWSRVAPADASNWWDQPGPPARTGAHGAADPATGFLDAGEAQSEV